MTSWRNYLRLHFEHLLEYWSRGDAYWAAGINRIFVYWAAWLTLRYHLAIIGFDTGSDRGVAAWLALHPAGLWQPHGLARLLIVPPQAGLVWALCWLAIVTTIAAIVGLGGRVVTVISALSLSLLVALTLSWQPYWSHGFNILCLVPLAFMWNGAPSLSVDEVIRKYVLKRPAPVYPLWPSLLGQATIALFLFAAFYAKLGLLRHTVTPDWVFSDNLRNSVTMPYAMRGYAMTWWVRELVSVPLLYVGAAAAHMFMQGFPIFAIFTRSPYWRLAEGAMFFLGTALLYFIMTLGVGEWFLLCALFVDWDYFIAQRWPAVTGATTQIRFWPTARGYYALAFVALFAIVAATKSSWSNGFYPFSPMDFYSTVNDPVSTHERLRRLAFVHRPYRYWLGNDLTFHKSGYVNDYRAVFDSNCSYVAPQADDKAKIALTLSRYNNIIAHSGSYIAEKYLINPWSPWRYYPANAPRFVETGTTRLEMSCSIGSIPAYPSDPLSGLVYYRRLVSVYEPQSKTVLMATGHLDSDQKIETIRTYGFVHPEVELFYTPDPTLTPGHVSMKPLPGHWITPSVFAPVKKGKTAWYTTIRIVDSSDGKVYDFWGPYLTWDFNGKR